MDKHYDYLLKIILIGCPGTGKTNFQSKLCRNQFNMESEPTIGIEFGIRDVVIESHTMRLQIWDTAGQEKYLSMTSGYFRNAIGVFLIYDVTKKETFDMIQKWLHICKQFVDQHTIFYLVGNKMDLEHLREVTKLQCKQFAILNNILYGECSAATGENVEVILIDMISNIYQVMMSNEILIENPLSKTSILSKNDQNNENQCCF